MTSICIFPLIGDNKGKNTIQMNNSQLIHDIWVDGGNTEGLLQKVKYAYSWDTYELYADLISKSPYLSDSVLLATIYQTNVLPDIMVKYILIANPQSLNNMQISGAIYDYRYDMFSSFAEEESYITDTISPRQQLESNITYYATERKSYVDLLKQYYLANPLGLNTDNLIQLLAGESDINSLYELAYFYISKNDSKNLSDVLSSIPQMIDPNDQAELDKFSEMTQLMPIIFNLENGIETIDSLNADEQSYVYNLAENNDNLPSMLAKAIRMQIDTSFHYDEPIYVADTLQTKSKIIKKTNKPLNTTETLNMYPNPSKDYVIVDYRNNTPTKEVLLVITDMQGRLQKKMLLNVKFSQNLVDVHNFVNGMYNFTIFVDGKQKASNKIVIQN